MSLNKLAKSIHKTAKEKGWYESDRSFGDYIALAHSELSEALEAYRTLPSPAAILVSPDSDKPEGVAIEFADCIIRILDTCAFYEIDIDKALKRKMAYNETRTYRHGGKAL